MKDSANIFNLIADKAKAKLGGDPELGRQILSDPDVIKFLDENSEKINRDKIIAALPALYEYHRAKNSKTGYVPVLFIDLAGSINIKYRKTIAKQREDQLRKRRRNIKTYGVDKEEIYGSSLKAMLENSIKPYNQLMKAISDSLIEFVADMKKHKLPDRGLIFAGDYDFSQNELLYSIAREAAIKGYKSYTIDYIYLVDNIKDVKRNLQLGNFISEILEADIVLFTNFYDGFDQLDSRDLDLFLNVVLQSCYAKSKPVFFSSTESWPTLTDKIVNLYSDPNCGELSGRRLIAKMSDTSMPFFN